MSLARILPNSEGCGMLQTVILYLQKKTVLPLDLFDRIVFEGGAQGLKSANFGFMTEPTINKRYFFCKLN